ETYLPEEFYLFRERIEKLKAEGSLRFERKFVRKNGEIVPVEVSLSAIRGGCFQAILRDISERKRGEALLAGEKRLLEMVAKGDPLGDILDAICRLVEELCTGSLCSNRVLGTFAMYYRKPTSPAPQQHDVIEQITHLASITIERQRAEEALRASEQVARGQVEALTYSLDVLATAPAPDRFLGQMLSTMGRLLDAQSVVFWLLDEANELLVFRAAAQGSNFTAGDPKH